ncbi:MAG: bifunctional oligoribonuclease/PAP phosphatase NrnA [Limnochordaceae bacterium]|nr:bifunctional oligoribonuclease/PAP phosphatase NrnA [Limnochordaceae bacterium]
MTARWPETERALQTVAHELKIHDRIAIIGHVDPDLDSIGSILALRLALESLGKTAWAISPGPDPEYWHFLPGHDQMLVGAPEHVIPELAVVLDTEVRPDRLGASWELIRRAPRVVNVDHHATNDARADVAFIEPAAGATGELVYYLIRVLGVSLTPDIAACLYSAILTDTGSFRFSNTTARTLAIGAELVEAGVDPHELSMAIYDTRSWEFMRLLGRMLDSLKRTEDGRIAWMELALKDAQQAGVPPSEMEGLVQYPRMIHGVEVALLFKELEPGKTRVSLRSQRYVDVSAIARAFGGGGHLRAAGCTLEAPLEEAVRRVVAACQAAVATMPAVPARDGRR